MKMIYNFINEHKTINGLALFAISKMIFMKSTLAIANQEVFLLEEVTNDAIEGPFIKYIGNGFTRPFNFLDSEELC